jgi:hypothetical protein
MPAMIQRVLVVRSMNTVRFPVFHGPFRQVPFVGLRSPLPVEQNDGVDEISALHAPPCREIHPARVVKQVRTQFVEQQSAASPAVFGVEREIALRAEPCFHACYRFEY